MSDVSSDTGQVEGGDPQKVRTLTLTETETGVFKREITWGDGRTAEETVWPIWVPPAQEETAADRFHTYWSSATDQTRSTAKWMATVLGGALAALVGTAPLTGLRSSGITALAIVFALAGLVLIGLTLFLVLRVLIPVELSYADLLAADEPARKSPLSALSKKGALAKLKKDIESSQEVSLPIGINNLAELAARVRLEEITLSRIAESLQTRGTGERAGQREECLTAAQKGRAAWLAHLTSTMERWTTVASFVRLRAKADLAKILGVVTAIAGTGCVVVAFVLPAPAKSPQGFTDYRLTDGARERLADTLGADCRRFDGHLLSKEGKKVTLLVKENGTCASARITVNEDDLGPSGTRLPEADVSE